MLKHSTIVPSRLALAFLLASAATLGACARKEAAAPSTETTASETTATEPESVIITEPPTVEVTTTWDEAIADPARPAEDRAADDARRPREALELMQVEPGDHVFEMEAGAGWYTELLSRAVGPTGVVIMQNPPGFVSFLGDKLTARTADGRLPNVTQSLTAFDALAAEDGTVDLVTWVQGPHELYYTPEDGSNLGDPAKSYAEIYRILKPGGAFFVIDHSAVKGAPQSSGNDLHRIDRDIVVAMAEAAGFKLETESDFLANPGDTRDIGVFDPAIRGHTDQFALRFRK